MTTTSSKQLSQILINGLWTNNPGLVQLLGLCPLLAVSNTLVNGLGLGIATLITLLISNILVSTLRPLLKPEIRIVIFVLIIASIVTVVELLMSAYWQGIYQVLGLFIPLIVTNCMIIGRAEAFASRNTLLPATLDALAMGFGFLWLLALLGALRELIGQATLFSGAHLMFGPTARSWTVDFSDHFDGLVIALLPPGAFFMLGLLLAGKNWIDQKCQQTLSAPVNSQQTAVSPKTIQ